MVQAYYQTLKADKARIMQESLLEHEIYDGRRLLAISRQEEEELNLETLSPANAKVLVISMNPPLMESNKQAEDMQRIEVRVLAWLFDGQEGTISVQLSGY
jgi:hypothetical protein